MRLLFLSPGWPIEMPHYVRALARRGAAVIGVGDAPRHALAPELRAHLADYVEVPAIRDEDAVIAHLERSLPVRPDRVEALWEPVMVLAARLRERWRLPGMDVDTVRGFRDKPLMRARVEAAGLPVPRTLRARTAAEARVAAAELGYPLILKPTEGAGSADTWRVGSEADLERAMAASAHVPEVAVEQFVDGQEYTCEALCVDGRAVFTSVSMYLPNTLEARQNEWISPIIATFRAPTPEVQPGIDLARGVLGALRMGSGMSHMEWFASPRGPVFGEIACRPPGANMVDLMNRAGDHDLYGAWAEVVTRGAITPLPARPYCAAVIFKRALGEGRIRAIEGLGPFLARFGRWVSRVDLLAVGAPRRDWKATFLSDGNVVVRHPDWEACLEMARAAATEIRLYAG